MLFSSLTFLFFFLPACLICYYAFPQRQVRNLILTVFSLIFYAWGEPIWVSLLIISSIWGYLSGLFIDHLKNRKAMARLGVISSLVVNLGLLTSFKYADFIVETVNALTGLGFKAPGILLPIGISFYTFQAISYTIDVYRGKVPAQKNFLNFMLFVVCFHQLVAGPIVRYAHIAREIEERVFNVSDFSNGVTRFCKGLFKKVFIANTAGEQCLQFLGQDMGQTTVAGEWFGLLMFTLQIYFDFSGYSDMAIGLGRMFGFHYHENFKHPYTATSITDFWRRWHISLGTFFRDYVYIPLGGNRRYQMRNMFVVWGLTGIWHGASWNFVLWGLYFGVILWFEKTVWLRVLDRVPPLIQHVYAIFFIVLGWSIFYFTDLSRLGSTLKVLFGLADVPQYDFRLDAAIFANAYWLVFALVMCAPMYSRAHASLKQHLHAMTYQWAVLAQNLLFLGVSVVLLVGKTYNPFIYFRF